jgi:release factor glutamine methyltransferase
MTLAERIAWAADLLRRAGVPDDEAPGDAEVLARHALDWDVARLVAERRESPPYDFEERFIPLIERRCRREPVSHIVGRKEFWGLEFIVTADVLTPRPETELIVEEAIAAFPVRDAKLIVDVGTGSGCLAVVLAREFPDADVLATDISEGALVVARENAKRHGVHRRITFEHADLLPPTSGDIDLLVSNPPYVPTTLRDALPPEVRDFEPEAALFGGPAGLDMYPKLLRETRHRLSRKGVMIIEVGYDQSDHVSGLAGEAGWTVAKVREDLQGIPRTLVLKSRA